MAAQKFKFVSPGIFLNEIDQSQIADFPVGLGPVIIGRTERGPGLRPTVVNSFSEFVEVFGNPIAGGASADVWRNGNYTAPTYASFAAMAYLRNNTPATIVRLVGYQHTNAGTTEDAQAGWGTELDAGTANAKGAYGLFVMRSGSSTGNVTDLPQTSSLAAVWYMTDVDTTIAISGNIMHRHAEVHHTASHAVAIATSSANASGEFVALIGTKAQMATEPPTAERFVFNFDRTSEKYIRSVFNTNPQKTNSDITPTVEKYWLGDTYERSILDPGRTALSSYNDITHGVLFGLATGNGAQWADHSKQAEPARTGWFVAQDTNPQAQFKPESLKKLFRLVAHDASGDWLQNNLKVSIKNIKPPTSQNPAVPQYGTFTVVLRKITDQDTSPNIVEQFSNCNLNPDSADYIARKIGNKYASWDDDKKAYRSYGKYNNNSRFIYVEMFPGMENGEGVGLLPFGFHGPPKITDIGPGIGFATATILVVSTTVASYDGGTFTLIDSADTSKTYIFDDDGGGATGTLDGANVRIQIQGLTNTDLISEQVELAIKNANGHNGTITVARSNEDAINDLITLTQATAGSAGNNTITRATVTADNVYTIAGFTGGGVVVAAGDVGADDFILTNDESFLGNTDSDDRDYSTDFAVITNNAAATGQALSSSYLFPSAILRAASNQPGSNFAKPTQPYFGIDVALSGSTKYAPSTSEVLRALPASLITYTRGSSDESSGKVVPSHIFTLDNIVVPGLGDTTSDTSVAKYVSGSRKNVVGTQELNTVSVTAQSGAYFLLTASSMGYNKFTTVFHGGFDGLDVTEADPFRNTFMGSSATETTNYAFYSLMRAINTVKDPEVVECNMMSVPGLTNTTLTDYLIDSCEERADALAIIDLANDYIPDADTSVVESDSTRRPNVDQAVNVLKSRQLNSSYGACYFPWVQIRDTLSNKILAMPPSVVALGAISYSESVRELWFAPAGFTRGGLSAGTAGLTVLNTKHHLTSEERDKLYEVNVNPIASFPAEGVVIFGQKTLQATTSALDRINVRRLLIHIKKEVSRIAATILFEQNVQATWLTFTAQVDAFLVEIKAGLGLTDYKIVLDETTTTPDLIDRNILYAKIFLKPAQAIEFIALDFIVTDSGASFAD